MRTIHCSRIKRLCTPAVLTVILQSFNVKDIISSLIDHRRLRNTNTLSDVYIRICSEGTHGQLTTAKALASRVTQSARRLYAQQDSMDDSDFHHFQTDSRATGTFKSTPLPRFRFTSKFFKTRILHFKFVVIIYSSLSLVIIQSYQLFTDYLIFSRHSIILIVQILFYV
jgi:hypothetical protein